MHYRKFLWFVSGCVGFVSLPALALYEFSPVSNLTLGVGGYIRGYTGKMESYQYNSVFKTEPRVMARYDLSDDVYIKGQVAYRIARNDRFASKKISRVYDAYGTLSSKTYGTLNVGKLLNIAYLLHQGSVDVSCLDVDDSDISQFFKTPKSFFSPRLTYIATDSRDPKLTYVLPEIYGVTAGITFAQSENIKPDTIAPNGIQMDHGKGVIGAMRYRHEFTKEIWAALSLGTAFYRRDRYFRLNETMDANHREYSIGTKFGYRGLTVGWSYKRMMFPDAVRIKDSGAFSTGIAYRKDAYSVSLSWLHSQAEFDQKNKYSHVMLSNRYDLTDWSQVFISVGQVGFFQSGSPTRNNRFGIGGFQVKL